MNKLLRNYGWILGALLATGCGLATQRLQMKKSTAPQASSSQATTSPSSNTTYEALAQKFTEAIKKLASFQKPEDLQQSIKIFVNNHVHKQTTPNILDSLVEFNSLRKELAIEVLSKTGYRLLAASFKKSLEIAPDDPKREQLAQLAGNAYNKASPDCIVKRDIYYDILGLSLRASCAVLMGIAKDASAYYKHMSYEAKFQALRCTMNAAAKQLRPYYESHCDQCNTDTIVGHIVSIVLGSPDPSSDHFDREECIFDMRHYKEISPSDYYQEIFKTLKEFCKAGNDFLEECNRIVA